MRHTTVVPILIAAIAFGVAASRPAPVAASTPPATPTQPMVTLHGKVELSPGVPCSGCTVVLEGTPLSMTTDASGLWSNSRVPSGMWIVRASHPSFGSARASCGGASGEVPLCPTVVVAMPGGVSGRVTFGSTSDYDTATIGIPELGIYTQINCGGGYLLTGVAPGWRKVVVTTNTSSKELWANVQPALVTMKMNLTFLSVPPNPN